MDQNIPSIHKDEIISKFYQVVENKMIPSAHKTMI